MNNTKMTLDLIFEHKFADGFECALDINGIIWIKYPNEEFERPCMKLCYDVIKTKSIPIAKYILAKSCEMQNDECIWERANKYDSL